MSVLQCLEWIMTANNIVTCIVLLMFAFGLLFKLLGYGGR